MFNLIHITYKNFPEKITNNSQKTPTIQAARLALVNGAIEPAPLPNRAHASARPHVAPLPRRVPQLCPAARRSSAQPHPCWSAVRPRPHRGLAFALCRGLLAGVGAPCRASRPCPVSTRAPRRPPEPHVCTRRSPVPAPRRR
jgi:hypothetical protein